MSRQLDVILRHRNPIGGLNPTKSQEERGYLDSLLGGFKSGGAGVYSGLAQFLNATDTANYFDDVAKTNAQRKQFDGVSWDWLTDPEGAAYELGQGLGSFASLLPVTAAAGLALPEGAAAGGAALLGRVLTSVGARNLAAQAAGTAGKNLVRFGMGNTVRAIPEAMSEGGNVEREMLQDGRSADDARLAAWETAGKNVPLLVGSNALETLLLGTGLGSIGAKPLESLGTRVLKAPFRAAPTTAFNMAHEGTEEALQNYISSTAQGKEAGFAPWNWTQEQWNEFRAGALLGGVLGGGSGMYHAAQRHPANISKDDFFNAVGLQESGGDYNAENGRTGAFGKYQIMPENWASWAKQAGLSPDAEKTAANQEIVARHKLGEYYDKYGEEGALVAWYAGEQNARRWVNKEPDAIDGNGNHYSWDKKQGAGNEPSIREYVQESLGRVQPTQENGGKPNSNAWDAAQAAAPFMGKRMDNGENGCVEAVTKIGAKNNAFLADQLKKGVVYVPTLVENAGDLAIPFDAAKLENGDVIVYADDKGDCHVVLYDGKGGYVGNSTSQQKVVHGEDYTAMGAGIHPSKIIKTSNGNVASKATNETTPTQQNAPTTQETTPTEEQAETPEEFAARLDAAIAAIDEGTITKEQREKLFDVANETLNLMDMREDGAVELYDALQRAVAQKDSETVADILREQAPQKLADIVKPRKIAAPKPQEKSAQNKAEEIKTETPNLEEAQARQEQGEQTSSRRYGSLSRWRNLPRNVRNDAQPTAANNTGEQFTNALLGGQVAPTTTQEQTPTQEQTKANNGVTLDGLMAQAQNKTEEQRQAEQQAQEDADNLAAENQALLERQTQASNAAVDKNVEVLERERAQAAALAQANAAKVGAATNTPANATNNAPIKTAGEAKAAVAPRAIQAALAPMNRADKSARAKQGINILRVAQASGIELPKGLGLALRQGDAPAIVKGQRLLRENGIGDKAAETSREKSAQNEQERAGETTAPAREGTPSREENTQGEEREGRKRQKGGGAKSVQKSTFGNVSREDEEAIEGFSRANGGEYNAATGEYDFETVSDAGTFENSVKEYLAEKHSEETAEEPQEKSAQNPTQEENIENGKKAVQKILNDHDDVKGAMYREEVGDIDFVYGKEGTKEKDYEDGYGIAKILKKHGQKAVDMIPEVIAKGKFSQEYKDRVYFEYDNFRSVVRLTWDGKAKTWLVTNFEQTEKDSRNAEEDRRSASVNAGTSSDNENLSAETIPQNAAKNKSAAKRNTINDLRETLNEPKADKAIQTAAEKGFRLVKGENAIESPDGTKYYLNEKGIEKFEEYARKQESESVETQEEAARQVPQAEATGHDYSGLFRAKYRNGKITVSLKANPGKTMTIDWEELQSIVADQDNNDIINKTLPMIRQLTEGVSSKAWGYLDKDTLWFPLFDALRNVKGKIGVKTRLKEDTPQIRERMKNLIEERNIEKIFSTLSSNLNTVSIQAFSDITGVKLSPVMKTRMEQVKEYFGEEYTEWEKAKEKATKEKERQEAEERERKQKEKLEQVEKDWQDGKTITSDEFLLLCDKYDVDVPIATKGVLKNKIGGIDKEGSIHGARVKKYPQGVADTYRRLVARMKESADSTNEATESLFHKSAQGIKTPQDKSAEPQIVRKRARITIDGEGVHATPIEEETVEKETQKAKEENTPVFGTEEEAFAGIEEVFGIQRKSKRTQNNSVITSVNNPLFESAAQFDDNLDDLIKEFQKEASKISANPVFNPKLYELGAKIGLVLIRRGARSFSKWAEQMTAQIGEVVKPWLKSIWQGIKNLPQGKPFDERKIRAIVQFVGHQYEQGNTSLEKVSAVFRDSFDEEAYNENKDYIRMAYEAVQAYFNPDTVKLEEAENEQKETAEERAENRSDVDGRGRGESGSVTGGHRSVSPGQVRETDAGGREGGNSETGAVLPKASRDGRGTDGADNAVDGRSDGGRISGRTLASTDASKGSGAGIVQADLSVKETSTPLTPQQDGDKPQEVAGHNYRFKENDGEGGGAKTKYKNNVAAVRLLKQLEAENRRATPEEQAILAKWNGWGTVKDAFTDNPNWRKENAELRELLTDEEYAAAKKASLNAFYTTPEVVTAMWQGLKRLGFNGGRVLDPSMGSGRFFGFMPAEMEQASTLHGVEKDSLTGRLAKQLFQKAAIDVQGYEQTTLPDNYFDLAISNVPFGDTVLHDPAYQKTSTGENVNYRIHNYFFAKTIDKVRPGGLVAFITGPGTMQTESAEAKLLRAELSKKAVLVAAYKLPGSAFAKDAGTEVTTDVLILRKKDNTEADKKLAQKWDEVGRYRVDPKDGSFLTSLPLNEYYLKHPEHMLGEPTFDKLYGGGQRFALTADKGRDTGKELAALMKKLPKDAYKPVKGKKQDTVKNSKTFLAEAGTREQSFTVKDGVAYQNRGGENVPVASAQQKIVKDFVGLKNSLNALLQAQIDPNTTDGVLAKLRGELNKQYDVFVKAHGYLNAVERQNDKGKKQRGAAGILGADPLFGQVAAIEKYNKDKKSGKETAEKADIFTKRTVGAIEEVTTANDPADALAISIAQRGGLDFSYMAKLLSMKEEEIVAALGDMIYRDPGKGIYALAEEYLSGNVREKLAIAKETAKTNPKYKRNVEALEKVQPVDYTEQDIKANLGATWIPTEVYEDFTAHMVGARLSIDHNKLLGSWKVNLHYAADRVKMLQTWGAGGFSFADLLEKSLAKQDIVVKFKDEEGKTHINQVATAAAVQKAEDIQREFEKWLWKSPHKEALLKSYNKIFNSEVERQYDGSALTFPGLARQVAEKLYPHQKNAIWRMMQGGNTLLAHCVGAGKTWEMQIAGMEMKRVGLCRKPMYIVPNNIVQQFRKEFYEVYPNAKLLVLSAKDLPGARLENGAEDFNEKLNDKAGGKEKRAVAKSKETAEKKQERLNKRRAGLSRIATEDWDGIIISHDMFAKMPMSPEYYQKFYQNQVDELEAAILQMKAQNNERMDRRALRGLETSKENLLQKLQRNVDEDRKEVVIPFEELGVDQIFVDEADLFKNLTFHTKMSRLSGISQSNAKRSTDMYVKTMYLSDTLDGRGVVFATGTPVSNTMNELFTMQRYLDRDHLHYDLGMNHFDSWASMFGVKKDEAEPNPNGDGFVMRTKLKFTNLKVLGKEFRRFADIKIAEDLPYLKRPKLKNGERTVVAVEAGEKFAEYKKTLVERSEKIKHGQVKPDADNMLKLSSDFRNASLDLSLVTDSVSINERNPKLEAVGDKVKETYDATNGTKGTQVIFLDLGTPKAAKEQEAKEDGGENDNQVLDTEIDKGTSSIYEKLKKIIISRGVPEDEIAFVHDAKNTEQRQALFERFNDGEIRVLIGSTPMMGAGTNFQKHLAALHHIDCPWKPRDIEQREGRILRAGNENAEVEIFTYVTKGSYDANMWDKVRYKQQMIDSVMRGDPQIDEMEDVNSNTSASFGEVEALAMDNPLLAEKVAVDAEVMRLKSLAANYRGQQLQMEQRLKRLPRDIEQARLMQERAQKDIAERKNTKGDNFRMKLAGRDFAKRADAQKQLDAIAEVFKDEDGKEIGEIGGFKVMMRHEPQYTETRKTASGETETVTTGRNIVQLVNNGSYTAEPSIASMEHALNNAPDKILATAKTSIEKLTQEKAGLEEELKKPFEKQAALDDALKRQENIQKELDKKQKGASEEEETAPEEDKEAATKEETSKETAEPKEAPKETPTQPQREEAVPNDGNGIFTIGEHTHTKTGEKLPQAKLLPRLTDNAAFSQLRSIAEKHGGGYSRFAKMFLFPRGGKEGRDAFVREATGWLMAADSAKFSKQGSVEQALAEAEFVGDDALNSQQKKLQEFAAALNCPISFFKTRGNLHGLMSNGVVFLNVNSNMSLPQVFHHEVFHWLKSNNPQMYREVLNALKDDARFTAEQLQKWREKTGRHNLTDDEAVEEMLSDEFEKVAGRTAVFQKLAKENPTLLQRFVAWIKRLMDRFAEHFHNPQGKLTTAQRDAFAESFGRMVRNLRDNDGRKIFSTYKNGREIRLANGQFLPSVRLIEKFSATIEGFKNAAEINALRRKYENTDQWLKAPNGKKTNLTEEQWLTVRTKAFKEWFGDWENDAANASKVVDENGEPKVMYHATGATFDVFQSGNWAKTIYFASTPKAARKAARSKKNVMSCFLSIKLPVNSQEKPLDWYDAEDNIKAAEWRKQKHDGVFVRDEAGISVAVFAPNQIKSATDNNGDFDATNDNIKFSAALDNAANVSDNASRKRTTRKINDYLTIRADGHFDVKLLHERPRLGEETEKVRIARRKSEVANMDKLLDVKNNPGAYVQLLSEKSIADIKNKLQKMRSYERLAKEYKLQYNALLARYSPTHTEQAVIGGLFNLKGAIYYAEQRGNIAGGNQSAPKFTLSDDRGNSESVGRNDRQQNLNINTANRADNRGGFSTPKFSLTEDNTRADEATKSWFGKATDKLAKALHLKGDNIITDEERRKKEYERQKAAMDEYIKNPTPTTKAKLKHLKVTDRMLKAYQNGEEYAADIGLYNTVLSSPSRIARKVAEFRIFFRYGERAMNKLVQLRTEYSNDLTEAMNLVKKKEDMENLESILWAGDKEGREYTREELAADGVPENVIDAYTKIRGLIGKAWQMLDDAQKRPQTKSAWLSQNKIDALKENIFVKVEKIGDKLDDYGRQLVTYTEYANKEREFKGITAEALERMKNDDAIQILHEEETLDGKFDVKIREGRGGLGHIKGYMPHFWHSYLVYITDKDGNIKGDPLTSGRTERDAVKLAQEWLKNNTLKDGEQIGIAPRMMDFSEFGINEDDYAPTVGDKDYKVMLKRIAERNMMTLDEAKSMLDGAVKLKNRHRFLGNLLKRTNVKGYTEDTNYVLRHYFNQAARYVALETEFKPQAISMFERLYGSFDKDYRGKNTNADYVKDYINDINGDPSTIEKMINDFLNKSDFYRKWCVPAFGERAALTLVTGVTGRVSYLKLGLGNLSSALLNFTQLVNAGGYLGDYKLLSKHLKRDKVLTAEEKRILKEVGTYYDIGLDTATGYDQNRGYGSRMPGLKQLDRLGNFSMGFFQWCDSKCRIATTLAAYEQAKAKGMTDAEAVAYARKLNRDANFSYGAEDAPNIFRRSGVLGKLGLQFMKYPVKQLEVIADFMPANKKTTWGQKARFWIPYLAMCGLMGLPFLDWLDDLFGEKLGLFPKDEMQEMVMKYSPNDTIAKMAMYGAPALFNIDVSKRAGLASIVPQDLWGAGVSTVTGTVGNVMAGEYTNALRSFSPGLWNIYAASVGEAKGKRDRVNTVYDDVFDRLIRFAGFKSVDETLPTDISRIKNHREKALTNEKHRAIDDFIADPTGENARRLKELGITKKQVDDERKKKKLDRRGRMEDSMSKKAKERNRDLLEFSE